MEMSPLDLKHSSFTHHPPCSPSARSAAQTPALPQPISKQLLDEQAKHRQRAAPGMSPVVTAIREHVSDSQQGGLTEQPKHSGLVISAN